MCLISPFLRWKLFGPVILTVECLGYIEGSKISFCVYCQLFYDPYDHHLGSEVLLGDDSLIDSIICCLSIVFFGVVPQVSYWIFFPQVFTVWVNDRFHYLRIRINCVLEFSKHMDIVSSINGMYYCLEARCWYIILYFLVELCPLVPS